METMGIVIIVTTAGAVVTGAEIATAVAVAAVTAEAVAVLATEGVRVVVVAADSVHVLSSGPQQALRVRMLNEKQN